MPQLRPEDFDVNLMERRVTHKPSGITVSFYEYNSEADWLHSDSVTLRDNPGWPGNRMELARMAQETAIARGMKARKPERAA
jgi:hypothetical protein